MNAIKKIKRINMKTSTVLFIVLAFFCLGGLTYTNYELNTQYTAIDKTDPFYAYDKFDETNYHHIVINGGNKDLVKLTPAPSSTIYRDQQAKNDIEIKTINDTLYINFADYLTYDDYRDIRPRDNPTVVVQHSTIESLTVTNGVAAVELTDDASMLFKLTEASFVQIETSDLLGEIGLSIQNKSRVNFMKNTEKQRIRQLNLNLADNGSIDLKNLIIDSLTLDAADQTQITAGANFFRR